MEKEKEEDEDEEMGQAEQSSCKSWSGLSHHPIFSALGIRCSSAAMASTHGDESLQRTLKLCAARGYRGSNKSWSRFRALENKAECSKFMSWWCPD